MTSLRYMPAFIRDWVYILGQAEFTALQDRKAFYLTFVFQKLS